MKNSQPLTLSKKYSFPILDTMETEIEVIENPYDLPIEELFTMAARINKKRSFLFVSKVLGKHLPINPDIGLVTASLLAVRYLESVKGLECKEKKDLLASFLQGESDPSAFFIPETIDPLIIGFAETATALGHAFFDCFQSAFFFHTTREELAGQPPVVTFEEEHSHATSHRCYIPLEMISNEREVVLVDDELTTGKTALNIIQSIQASFPRKEYTVVSILDWRSEENRKAFSRLEEELGITIHVVSLLAGTIQVTQLKDMVHKDSALTHKDNADISVERLDLSDRFSTSLYVSANPLNKVPYLRETGRFGLESPSNRSLHMKAEEAGKDLKCKRTGNKTLCLGTGEFMYLPMKIASYMGDGVVYHSTTRSPIYIQNALGYGARYGTSFPNPEDNTISHFVYNIPPAYYDEVFLFFEREIDREQLRPFLMELNALQIPSVKLVFFSNGGGDRNAKDHQ